MSTRRPTTRARADDGFARDDDEDDGAHDDVAANTIVVYTKPGCCLCDGLKDKLDAAVDAAARAPPGASLECLRDFALCVRDVSTNAVWAESYAGSVPRVFVRVAVDAASTERSSVVSREFARPPPKRATARVAEDLASLVRRASRAPARAGWTVVTTTAWDAPSSSF